MIDTLEVVQYVHSLDGASGLISEIGIWTILVLVVPKIVLAFMG